MSVISKSERSLYKKELSNERTPAIAFKNLQFAHKAAAGETFINFNSLTQPDPSEWAYSNPSTSELGAAEILTTQKSLLLFSSARGWLTAGASYRVTSNNTIAFTDSFGTSLDNEVFTGYILNTARTGSLVADTDQILVTGTLSTGNTDINVGKSFPLNYNANDQVGWVTLIIDGQVYMRNVGNATAAPSADGDYEEVDNGSGESTLLRVNNSFGIDVPYIVMSTALATIRPDGSMVEELEKQNGTIDSLVETVAVLAGVPESNFQASPSQPQLKQFGDRVIELEQIGSFLDDSPVADIATTGGFDDIATVTLTEGDWDVEGCLVINTGGTAVTAISAAISTTSASLDTATEGGLNQFDRPSGAIAKALFVPTGTRRINVPTGTTQDVYLVANLDASTYPTADKNSYLRARRLK